jgi:hypothetical protein
MATIRRQAVRRLALTADEDRHETSADNNTLTTGDNLINKTETLVAVLCGAAFLCGSTLAAEPAATAPARSLTWRAEEGSVALLCDGKMVWRHVHGGDGHYLYHGKEAVNRKPYMQLALLDGTELTRPWPIPKDYVPDDHDNHKGLWWSLSDIETIGGRGIRGVDNLWLTNKNKGTFATNSQVERHDDGSAVITMEVVYGWNVGPPLLNEKRTVSVGAPDASGMYLIEWEGVFTPAGSNDVAINAFAGRYGGVSFRPAGEMSVKKWQIFGDPEAGKRDQIGDKPARCRWVAMTGTIAGGQEDRKVTVAMFNHPSNPRQPPSSSWGVQLGNPLVCLPFASGAEKVTIKAGASLTLRYGVLVAPVKLEAAAVECHWKMFSEKKVEHAKPQ